MAKLKNIDKKAFENLCGIQCTKMEICDFFEITDKTLERWCKRTYKKSFSEVFRAKRGNGKISLRRTQWQQAQKSVPMSIWLGKQYLDQREPLSDLDLARLEKEKAQTEFIKEQTKAIKNGNGSEVIQVQLINDLAEKLKNE